MHYIPRNVSVRPHQARYSVRTFDELLTNNLYRCFIRCASSSNFFIESLQISDAFEGCFWHKIWIWFGKKSKNVSWRTPILFKYLSFLL